MLKPLLVATATLFSATIFSFDTAQVANAATQSNSVRIDRRELIAKSIKSSHLSAQKQSEIKSIHGVLTELYRGMNNFDADAIAKLDVIDSHHTKIYLEAFFKELKSRNISLSTEVKSIELLELTKNSAVVKITHVGRFTTPEKSGGYTQDSKLRMVKHQGHWMIGKGQVIVKPFKEYS